MVISEFVKALILAVVQGITEWIPVSSSGHLVVFQHLLGYEGSAVFDVALHFGTLMAVFVYFAKDIMNILRDVFSGKWGTDNGKTGLLIIVASIPAAVIGFAFNEILKNSFQSLLITGMGFAVTGLFLFIASLDFHIKKDILNWKDSLLVGIAQAISILPGVSRSGSTIATGTMLGLDVRSAARFSFLMSIPIIFGANILEAGSQNLNSEVLWAVAVSFFTGFLTLHLIFKYLLTTKKALRWFGAYALSLSIVVIVWALVV